MAKPFDNSTRFLTGLDPLSWVRLLHLKAERAELSNADFSTVSTAADALLILDDGKDAVHIEIMSYYDPEITVRLIVYNALGRKQKHLPLRSYLVLLCKEADHPSLNGIAKEFHSDCTLCHEFHYGVVRVWQIPAEELYACGLGVLPLTFIADIERDKLSELVHRTEERLSREATPRESGDIWTAIGLMLTLRYGLPFVVDLLKGVQNMKNSAMYQAIMEEGAEKGKPAAKLEGVREYLIHRLSRRFGPPDARILAALHGIQSIQQFDDLEERSLIVSNWKELLDK